MRYDQPNEYLLSAIQHIDARLGEGYAKAHPELIGAAVIARAIESAANTISVIRPDPDGGHQQRERNVAQAVATTPGKVRLLRSALDMFSPFYADRLPPEAKHVLATLSDDVVQLANDAWEAAENEIGKPYKVPGEDGADTYHRVAVRANELLRRKVPALDALSREDLHVVIIFSVR